MKKILTGLIIAGMMLTMASCGESTSTSEEASSENPTTEISQTDTTEEETEKASEKASSETPASSEEPSSETPVADESQTDASEKDTTEKPAKKQTDKPTDNTSETSIAKPVTMPDVLGVYYEDGMEQLKNSLTDAGFKEVNIIYGWAWGDGNPDKALKIMSQEPAPGTIVDANEESIDVIIYVQERGIEPTPDASDNG